MKALIFGGSGFIGRHLCRKLIDDDFQVTVLDVSEPVPEVDFKKISILDENLEKEVRAIDPDILVNLAAIKKVTEKNYWEALNVNVIGSTKIFQLAKEFKTPLFHMSSAAVYGKFLKTPADESHPLNPISLYGWTKLLGEKFGRKIMESSSSPVTIFRPTIVYGFGGDDVVTSFIRKSLDKNPITLFDGGIYKRDFLYVEDLTSAVALALKMKKSGIFNVGTGQEVKISGIVDIIKKFIPDIRTIDVKSEFEEVDQGAMNIENIKKELNFQPKYSLEEGIKETIDNYSENSFGNN